MRYWQSTRLSPSCQRGQRKPQGSWPGCQLRLCRVASHCCRELGALPLTTPGRRSLSRVGVCGKVEGLHCGVVQGKARAAGLPRAAQSPTWGDYPHTAPARGGRGGDEDGTPYWTWARLLGRVFHLEMATWPWCR